MESSMNEEECTNEINLSINEVKVEKSFAKEENSCTDEMESNINEVESLAKEHCAKELCANEDLSTNKLVSLGILNPNEYESKENQNLNSSVNKDFENYYRNIMSLYNLNCGKTNDATLDEIDDAAFLDIFFKPISLENFVEPKNIAKKLMSRMAMLLSFSSEKACAEVCILQMLEFYFKMIGDNLSIARFGSTFYVFNGYSRDLNILINTSENRIITKFLVKGIIRLK